MIFHQTKALWMFVRFWMFFLCLLAIEESWAGLKLYRAERLFELRNFSGAAGILSGVHGLGARNPKVLYLSGQSAWREGLKTGDKIWLQKAYDSFQKMTTAVPCYGKGWLYLALCRIAIWERGPGGLTAQEWQRDRFLLQKAFSLESGSAWMQYMTSVQWLRHAEFLSVRQKAEALERLKKSVVLHYSSQPHAYLKPALSVLWRKFSDFELLKQITPREADAYNLLIEFLDQKGLWKFQEEVFPKAVALNRALHDQKIKLGLEALKGGRVSEALGEFQDAYWVYQESSQAKAGILVVQEILGRLPENYPETLKIVLEEEEQDISVFLPFLGPAVSRTGDPFLEGIYAYRNGNDRDAERWFEKIRPLPNDLFLTCAMAETYRRLHRIDKALEILKPVLDEPQPDIRALVLLGRLDLSYREEASDRIEKVATRRFDESWWAWGTGFAKMTSQLNQWGRIGQPVNLMPGEVSFKITVRSKANSQGAYGYLLCRLWEGEKEQRIGTAYIDSNHWKTFRFSARTSGGKRRMELELLNAMPEAGDPRNPRVEFQTVEVSYGKA